MIDDEGLSPPDPRVPPLDVVGAAPCPTPAEALLAARVGAGLPLPPSYRAYAQAYGYGLLGGLLLIYVPDAAYGCDELVSASQSLQAFFREGLDEEWFEFEPDGDAALVARLIPFGISENGHYLAWDPGQPTGAGEYAIYVVGAKFLAVYRAGDRLDELLARCFDERVRQVLGPGYRPLPRTFRPSPRPAGAEGADH